MNTVNYWLIGMIELAQATTARASIGIATAD